MVFSMPRTCCSNVPRGMKSKFQPKPDNKFLGHRRKMRADFRRGLLGLIAMSLLLFARSVNAQAPTPSADDVNRVARQLYCPVCENIPLDVCPTEACAKWRADIRDRLAQGWTDEQIKTYFAEQYGDRVLAQPPARGLNLLLYLLPL